MILTRVSDIDIEKKVVYLTTFDCTCRKKIANNIYETLTIL